MKLFRTFLSAALLLAATTSAQAQEPTKQYYATVEKVDEGTVLYIRGYDTRPEVKDNVLFVQDEELSKAKFSSDLPMLNSYSGKNEIKRAVLEVNEDFKPTSTARWFYELKKMDTIEGLDKLNTEKVMDMNYMFYACTSLTSLDLRLCSLCFKVVVDL